jgi:hypothetical protein
MNAKTPMTIVLSFGIVLAAAGSAMAATPKGKVMPNKNLTNGETVTATGTGYTPGETVYVVECNKTVKKSGEDACDLADFVQVTANSKGKVPPTKFSVFTGTVGNGTCGTGKSDKDCYIAISSEDLSETAVVKIVFKVK